MTRLPRAITASAASSGSDAMSYDAAWLQGLACAREPLCQLRSCDAIALRMSMPEAPLAFARAVWRATFLRSLLVVVLAIPHNSAVTCGLAASNLDVTSACNSSRLWLLVWSERSGTTLYAILASLLESLAAATSQRFAH